VNTTVIAKNAEFSQAHFNLYQKYLNARHTDSDMATSTETGYIEFVGNKWCNTLFYELRIDTELVAVSIVDVLPQGLSAVYTFFDPEYKKQSLGQFVILWLIEEAKRRRLQSVYLGYWIKDCSKMEYKCNYRPIEALINQDWQLFPRNTSISN
jgi:arginine-tRNA-protein transferase